MVGSTQITYDSGPEVGRVLTPGAVSLLGSLHETFGTRREELLALRQEYQARMDAGERPEFPPETRAVRQGTWSVPSAPPGLVDRRVEITGPAERKMVINALNSKASVFMADFEDANAPTWSNMVSGQANLIDAVRREISLDDGERHYRLEEDIATLVVRPRGWHLPERHFRVNGRPMSAALFDFGLYAFHNAQETIRRGFGPYFYLPKLENYLEARLWADVFRHTEDYLGLQRGSIRATVLIETITAAFQMEEILYELGEYACGLNAGRWDYIFSVAKCFHNDPAFLLPDRSAVGMDVPFMRSYADLLVQTCHRRGAYAIGGMAAFVPNRSQPEVTEAAIAKVSKDKRQEAERGFDGTWVAHPDLVPVAKKEFEAKLGNRLNQLDRMRKDVDVGATDLLSFRFEPGGITRQGLETNVSVGLRYLYSWLRGRGAVAIDNLMEDAATAEISRTQIWQWLHHQAKLPDGSVITEELVSSVLGRTENDLVAAGYDAKILQAARGVFEETALANEMPPFLTLVAYELLD